MTASLQLGDLPKGLSLFDPVIRHEAKEAIEAGGEVFVSTDGQERKNGLFIYDKYEATGTIFTQSRAAFDAFFKLKPSSFVFSELLVSDLPSETWNIWQLDVDKSRIAHRFKHHVSVEQDAGEIERFIAVTQPETNRRWVGVALRNGDKCFVVRVGGRLVCMAWMTIAGDFARSHGLYVGPQFRRMGMMRDNLQARLIYLRSRHVHTLINEIAESNTASVAHAVKSGERIAGRIFLYTSPD